MFYPHLYGANFLARLFLLIIMFRSIAVLEQSNKLGINNFDFGRSHHPPQISSKKLNTLRFPAIYIYICVCKFH